MRESGTVGLDKVELRVRRRRIQNWQVKDLMDNLTVALPNLKSAVPDPILVDFTFPP
ncbi:MAG: hypothetical protein JWM11_1825 [Planctomycetaceae bacterium]|nr:hypothetical protein [Planctomycetaceae bacterium]